MKINKFKKLLIIFFTICFIIILHNVSEAASIGMSIDKSSAYVGDTFSVTISGINGKVSISGSSNISLSTSGTKWVEGSMTITGTAKSAGTGTITVNPIDASTTGADPQEVTSSASRSIKISEKPATPPTTTTTTPPTTTSKPTNSGTTTTKKSTTTTKTETKQEEKKEDNFHISSITLKGIKENEEQIDITLSPAFNKDTYEYTCNITSDIQKIDLQKDAGEYTNSILVTGLDELKEGENIITLQLAAENHEAKTYTIKVIKEAQETVETLAELNENNEEINKENNKETKTIMVSMPLWAFITMQAGIIVIEVLAIYFIPWKKLFKIRNKNIDIEE